MRTQYQRKKLCRHFVVLFVRLVGMNGDGPFRHHLREVRIRDCSVTVQLTARSPDEVANAGPADNVRQRQGFRGDDQLLCKLHTCLPGCAGGALYGGQAAGGSGKKLLVVR
jgi:hypothetical protein